MDRAGPVTRRHPPLGVWLAAATLAAAVLLLLGRRDGLDAVTPPRADAHSLNLARLERPLPDGALHVVAVGTSKMQLAVGFDDDLARPLRAAGQPLVFHRVTWNGATFEDIEPVLRTLQGRPPALLLIESDLVLIDRHWGLQVDTWHGRARLRLRALKQSIGGAPTRPPRPRVNHGEDRWPTPQDCEAAVAPRRLARYATQARGWRVNDGANLQAWLAPLRRLRQQGTRIVLLALPRAPLADAYVPPAFDRQVAQLRDRLVAHEGFESWAPERLPDRLYCDRGHVNPDGRRVYTQWLRTELHRRGIPPDV